MTALKAGRRADVSLDGGDQSMFAVIDTETTGLDPRRGHRILELAIVHVGPQLEVQSRWDTLLNPERTVGPSEIHGLRYHDVEGAPHFEDIAGDVADLIAQRILVAHNASFDVGFLRAEFRRAGYSFAPDALCTLSLADDLGVPTKLNECCEHFGVPMALGHSALIDAEAVGKLLAQLLSQASDAGLPLRFAPLGNLPSTLNRCGRQLARVEPFHPDTYAFVASLVRGMHVVPTAGVDAPEHAAFLYADLLDHALADRELTEAESVSLAALAMDLGLEQSQMEDIHRCYLTALVGVALADGLLSKLEAADLRRVATVLGVGVDALDRMLAGAATASRHLAASNRQAGFSCVYAGKTACLLGEPQAEINGVRIDRAAGELLTAAAGLVVAPRLTPAVDVAVATDADDPQAFTARKYSVRVVAERAFWPSLGIQID